MRRNCGVAPPDLAAVLDVESELFGYLFESLVVVAALAAGVLHAALLRRGVGGFVQQRCEHFGRSRAESFTADEKLVHGVLATLPAIGCEVPEPHSLGVAAAADGHDDLGDVLVSIADFFPGRLDRRDEGSGDSVGGHAAPPERIAASSLILSGRNPDQAGTPTGRTTGSC